MGWQSRDGVNHVTMLTSCHDRQIHSAVDLTGGDDRRLHNRGGLAVNPEDYRVDREDRDDFIEHIIRFRDNSDGQVLDEIRTGSPFPTPRVGEWLVLSEEDLTDTDDGVQFGEVNTRPEWSDQVYYKVTDVLHDFVHTTPDESIADEYSTGITVFTSIEVEKEKGD